MLNLTIIFYKISFYLRTINIPVIPVSILSYKKIKNISTTNKNIYNDTSISRLFITHSFIIIPIFTLYGDILKCRLKNTKKARFFLKLIKSCIYM